VSEIIKRLADVQERLNAPKSQWNKFGKYHYRSCEDILQGLKPLLGDAVVLISDEVKLIGNRVYIEASATFQLEGEKITVKGLAREPDIQKGMSESQITGSASSYARKYALNGLFLIDDNKDADTQDNSKHEEFKPLPKKELSDSDKQWVEMVKANNSVLETITNLDHRAMIKRESGI
jgi:hypothetical protein